MIAELLRDYSDVLDCPPVVSAVAAVSHIVEVKEDSGAVRPVFAPQRTPLANCALHSAVASSSAIREDTAGIDLERAPYLE